MPNNPDLTLLSSYRYDLPEELIAQTPIEKRDSSKLLVLDKNTGEIRHTVFSDIINYLNITRPDKTAPVSVTVERDGKVLTFENIKPFSDFQYTLGVNLEHKNGSISGIFGASFNYCISTARNVFITIGWLFKGTISFKELSGPVGIIGTMGSVVETRQSIGEILINLIYVCSFISINLGIMNLIPFPALDGSMLLLILIEKLRGKPIPQEKMGMISMVGFVILICVLIATLFNDIPRWFL
jgi:regulator of sigma E protease